MKVRTSAPSSTDKHWIHTSNGGYNKCIEIDTTTGSVLPNCTGYCWGRGYEVLGKDPKLPTNDAKKWYDTWSGKKGKTPKVGSVLCLTGSTYGHVAFVEKVNSDGSIDVTQSDYYGTRFEYKKGIKSPYAIYGLSLVGFLYLDLPEETVKYYPMKIYTQYTYDSSLHAGSYTGGNGKKLGYYYTYYKSSKVTKLKPTTKWKYLIGGTNIYYVVEKAYLYKDKSLKTKVLDSKGNHKYMPKNAIVMGTESI